MIRGVVYTALLAIGVVATLIAPYAGAISCVSAYLLNPRVFLGYDLRFQLVTTVVFCISVLLHRQKGLRPVGNEGALISALWVFVGIAALSSIWAVASAELALLQSVEVAKTVFFATLLVIAIRTERQLSLVIMACVVGIVHAAIAHTVGIRFGLVPRAFARESGVLPESQAPVLIMFLPSMALLAVRGHRWERLLSWCGLPFVLNSIVMGYRRTDFLALVFQAVMLLLVLPRRVTFRLLPFLMIGLALFVFRLTPPDYWQWISTIKSPTTEASANSRLVINEASTRMLMDHPMGVGYRNYPDVSPRYLAPEYLYDGKRAAHNSYYTIACETGIVGFTVWAFAFGGAIWRLRCIRTASHRENPTRVELLAMGIELGLYGWLVTGITMAEHEVDPAYWCVAFAVVLTRLHGQEAEQSRTFITSLFAGTGRDLVVS